MDHPLRIRRALAMWLLLAAVAILFGALREWLLRPWIGEPWAHRAGTLAVCIAFVFLIDRFVRSLEPPGRPAELWIIGLGWLLLTVAFELIFGRLAVGASWPELAAYYDPTSGRLWWLVLFTLLLGPPVLGHARARQEGLTPLDRHVEFLPEDRAAEALGWLIDLFRDRNVRYAAAGGLAARAWGASRPLVDLDFYVAGEDLERLESELAPYVSSPLTQIESDHWSLALLKLEYGGVPLELSVAEGARYRDATSGAWLDASPDFDASGERTVLGVRLRVMDRDELLACKRHVDRAVDRADIAAIQRVGTSLDEEHRGTS